MEIFDHKPELGDKACSLSMRVSNGGKLGGGGMPGVSGKSGAFSKFFEG